MLPALLDPNCSSPGEREIYKLLKEGEGTDDWIVLHSLDIANHRRQISGEADFVVLIPNKGVLVVEVKSHHKIERRDGVWYYGHNKKPDPRGPFKQASEAMHSLRQRLVQRFSSFSDIPFWSAVILPSVDFSKESGEWHSWQVIDVGAYRNRPLCNLLSGILDKARDFLTKKKTANWFDPTSDKPTEEDCRIIAEFMRPDFEYYESPSARVAKREEELKKYTTDQFVAIDAMQSNDRVIFEGPAGTGKTLLAIETARRECNRNRKTLLLCYNRLLGEWLKKEIEEGQPGIECSTLHRYMLDVAGIELSSEEKSSTFWTDEVPMRASEILLESGPTFDELIIDEAQDILWHDNYLDVLDLSLKGGLEGGRWKFFGDFERQAIYGGTFEDIKNHVQARSGPYPIYSLRSNCRNTPSIATIVHLLGGLDPDYSRVLRPYDGIEPELRFYESNSDQQAILVQKLNQLYKEGFKGDDIIVLSSRADECVAKSIEDIPWKNRLRPLHQAKGGHIGYSTIHVFKGMEKAAVIVTDIDQIVGAETEALFYTAITRALHRLKILAHEATKAEIMGMISKPKVN
jgi:DNA polymerase III delta prime subunit